MVVSRSLGIALGLCALLILLSASAAWAVAGPALEIDRAAERSERFAKKTCAHDPGCVRHEVLNCRRQSRRVVLCRILDERKTEVQGRYECNRLIRIGLDPQTGRLPITGLGRWHC